MDRKILLGFISLVLLLSIPFAAGARGKAEGADETPVEGPAARQGGATRLSCVFVAGDKFFAVGSTGGSVGEASPGTGYVYASDDGRTFTDLGLDADVKLTVGAYGNGIIIVAGDAVTSGDNFFHNSIMFRSLDGGESWEEVPGVYGKRAVNNALVADGTYPVNFIEYVDGYFTAATMIGEIFISADGVEWDRAPIKHQEPTGMDVVNDEIIVWGFGNEICLGSGTDWRAVEIPEVTDVGQVFYENSMYKGYGWVAHNFGEGGGPWPVYEFLSRDGTKWTAKKLAGEKGIPRQTVKIGQEVYGIIDGSVKRGSEVADLSEAVYSGDEDLTGIALKDETIVITGWFGLLKYSADGSFWQDAVIK